MVRMTQSLLLSLAFVAGAVQADGDPVAGEGKSLTCQACHGADGNGIDPQYPKLAGQFSDYLAKALRDYKTGDRENPIMAGFVATLSDEDIDDLAAYYGTKDTQLSDLAGR